MAEDDPLFERGNKAASEARQLIELNWEWQDRVYEGVRRLRLKAIFEPRPWKVLTPQNVLAPTPDKSN